MAFGIKELTTACIASACLLAMPGCDDSVPPKTAKVVISGKSFELETAFDDQTRFHGLSDRTEIKPTGGMLFVFKDAEQRAFVMRDCPIPIDIIYLGTSGRVTATHKMVPEKPRSEEEKKKVLPRPGLPEWMASNEKYEARLKQYPSRQPAQFVIELKGNTLDELKVKVGDKVDLDREALTKFAK